jgi:hypothetical protein
MLWRLREHRNKARSIRSQRNRRDRAAGRIDRVRGTRQRRPLRKAAATSASRPLTSSPSTHISDRADDPAKPGEAFRFYLIRETPRF